MPAVFVLVTHGIRTYFPNLFGTARSSEPLSGPAGAHNGSLRSPIEDNKHKGFVQLESGRSGTAGSIERLFDGSSGPNHYTNVYSGQTGGRKEVNEEVAIPLHQIHVRDGIHVHGLSGPNGMERSAD